MTQDSQDNRSELLIYLSTSTTHLELAQLVQAQLEGEGYSVWIGEQRTEDDWQNIQSIVNDALRFAEASVLLVLASGDVNKLEAARQRHLPILLLPTNVSLSDILVELKQIVAPPPKPLVVPSEVDSDDSPADNDSSRMGSGRVDFRLLLALLLNLPTLVIMLTARTPRALMPHDWIQILLFALVLSIAGYAYSQERKQL